jgi:hypothetical protein
MELVAVNFYQNCKQLWFEPSSSTTTVLVINFAKVLDVKYLRIINEHQMEKRYNSHCTERWKPIEKGTIAKTDKNRNN